MSTTIKEKLQLLLNTKTQFKYDIINAGGTIDNSTPFSSYPAIYKTLKGGAPDGTAVEVSTEADMDALLTADNIGKFYKYTGETTDKYIKDTYYIIQDSDNPIVQECSGSNSGLPIEVTSSDEMSALLLDENAGKICLYTGETNDVYTNGKYYLIKESE